MAAFPLPPLALHIPDPLRDLIHHCESNCVAGCCGVDAFDPTAERLGKWFTLDPHPVADAAIHQFERLLSDVAKHRGPIEADEWSGCFNAVWQSPHDCLTYFAAWRRAIAEAVSQLSAPRYFSPAWLTEPVVGLSAAIVAERAFDRLPILADALEEAGCDNLMVLAHLRANDDHAHHCWVVDVLRVGTEPLSP